MPSRRKFVKQSTAAALSLFFLQHELMAVPSVNQTTRLKEIELLTDLAIQKMVDFYGHKLGFTILQENEGRCSFLAGSSILTFKHSHKKEKPFYHFAFNIPENKIRHALEWQTDRTDVIIPPNRLQHQDYPKNIVFFKHWNAHSVFFYDPADNLVEYIARHTINTSNNSKGFSVQKDILNISEIGLVVKNVKHAYQQLAPALNLKKYSLTNDQFIPMGNEHGLILLMGEESRATIGKSRKRHVCDTQITLHQEQLDFQLKDYPFIFKGKKL